MFWQQTQSQSAGSRCIVIFVFPSLFSISFSSLSHNLCASLIVIFPSTKSAITISLSFPAFLVFISLYYQCTYYFLEFFLFLLFHIREVSHQEYHSLMFYIFCILCALLSLQQLRQLKSQ